MSISLADWKGVPAPTTQLIEGRYIRLEKLDPARHGDDLFNALQGPGADPKLWDYLPYGPFPERSVFNDWLNNHAASSDPYFFSVIDRASGEVQGILSLMSIVPAQGRIEIGHVTFGAPMQRSPKSTEAVLPVGQGILCPGLPSPGMEMQQRQRPLQIRGRAPGLQF